LIAKRCFGGRSGGRGFGGRDQAMQHLIGGITSAGLHRISI